MKTVKLHDKNFDVYINEQQIKLRVEQMATEIFQSLNGKVPHFIAVLNGSFIFASDLLRAYPGDCKISFVKLSSYTGMESTGKVSKLIGLNEILDDDDIDRVVGSIQYYTPNQGMAILSGLVNS